MKAKRKNNVSGEEGVASWERGVHGVSLSMVLQLLTRAFANIRFLPCGKMLNSFCL